MRKNTTEFIEEAKVTHGDRYDYSKVEYVNNYTKVCIICPEHGEFWQTPNNHLSHHGCPKCSSCNRRTKIYGVGINDVKISTKDKENNKAYKTWSQMLMRCYSSKYQKNKQSYIGCSVCDEWLYFSNFKKWFDAHYKDGYALDKDILIQGNKVYSPESCCFVPQFINSILSNCYAHGEFKQGVSWNSKRGLFEANVSKYGKNIALGCFDSENEAFNAYCTAKYAYIKEVAIKAFNDNKIDDNVYDALLKYKIID